MILVCLVAKFVLAKANLNVEREVQSGTLRTCFSDVCFLQIHFLDFFLTKAANGVENDQRASKQLI